MKKPKLGIFLLVGIMVLSLAACSGSAYAPSAPQVGSAQPSHAGTETGQHSIKLTLAGNV